MVSSSYNVTEPGKVKPLLSIYYHSVAVRVRPILPVLSVSTFCSHCIQRKKLTTCFSHKPVFGALGHRMSLDSCEFKTPSDT